MTAFSAVIFYLLPSSSSGLAGVYDRHVYSDGVKWDLRDSWVLSSDEITVFMCAGFQTEWLSDRACKFPQVSPLSLPPWCHGWHCCCWVTTATWVLYKKKKCAQSRRNNTVILAAAASVTCPRCPLQRCPTRRVSITWWHTTSCHTCAESKNSLTETQASLNVDSASV